MLKGQKLAKNGLPVYPELQPCKQTYQNKQTTLVSNYNSSSHFVFYFVKILFFSPSKGIKEQKLTENNPSVCPNSATKHHFILNCSTPV